MHTTQSLRPCCFFQPKKLSLQCDPLSRQLFLPHEKEYSETVNYTWIAKNPNRYGRIAARYCMLVLLRPNLTDEWYNKIIESNRTFLFETNLYGKDGDDEDGWYLIVKKKKNSILL